MNYDYIKVLKNLDNNKRFTNYIYLNLVLKSSNEIKKINLMGKLPETAGHGLD